MKLNLSIYRLLCVFLLITCCKDRASTLENRIKLNINSNWFYLENNTDKLENVLESPEWKQVHLPHTWNALDATDLVPGYRRSASWYKKILNITNLYHDAVHELYFEGSNIETVVYVNGNRVGGHVGGYIGFSIDITKNIKLGENEVLVRVSNSYNPEIIPSQKSDFFIFGGITRDVWYQVKPNKHLYNVKVRTPHVSNSSAKVLATVNIHGGENSNLKVKATLINKENKTVVSSSFKVESNSATIEFNNINQPNLWDVDSPYLYTLDLKLLNGDHVIDKHVTTVGFRWFEFKEHGAFYLNGKRLLLRGTHRHEEHAGVGAAMTNAQHRKDMQLIKSMGANFVRLAHYPQDPEVYKACNELGLLVWDELPWCRGGVGNDVWKKNTKNMLKEIIEQNYNHPSVILWSLGNEIYWLPDFENGDDINKINNYLKELNTYAKTLDPSRKTAIRKYYEGADIVDVFSPSIWSGWYSGSYKSYQKAINQYKKQYPHFLHAEYGGSSHLGRHTENPITGEGKIQSDGWEEAIVQTDVANIAQIGDWSENYIVDLFDWHLRISENDSTFVGNIQWAFKDFGTPLRPENAIPYMNQKGLVDRAGNLKDAYYVFKSYWGKEPFAYIESHTWTERQGPKGKSRNVSVFSNCNKVELFLNNKSLGLKEKDIKRFPASGLNWDVNFISGKNHLRAVGYTKSKLDAVNDTLTINYRFEKNKKAKKLKLDYTLLKNGNYLVRATAVDKNGLRCLDYENRIYFQCLEGGIAIVSQGTPTGSEAIEMANGTASIEIVKNNELAPLKVLVINQNFKGSYLTIY